MKKKFASSFNAKPSPKNTGALAMMAQKAVDEFDILPELQKFIRPHREHEFEQLLENIRNEGVRDPLVTFLLDGRKVLVDGHHRWKAIQQIQSEGARVDYSEKNLDIQTIDQAKDWMIDNQLGRRNLTEAERTYYVGLRYNHEKIKDAKTQQEPLGKFFRTGDKAKEIGLQNDMTDRSVRNAAQYAQGLDLIGEIAPETKEAVLKGETKIKKADLQAIAAGKVAPEAILAKTQPKTDPKTGAPENQTTELRMPVKDRVIQQGLSNEEVKKLNSAYDKTEQVIRQLIKSGYPKAEIRWMLSQAVAKTKK
ncbi:hypothetical protein FUAX_54070 (plasmid) [Fulvitalea axinellae]|uniref:ParB/Sulfiredoxin domain-containing protein n=1 Tax=Fulvitalea axinellae TaxID=1182444 RepID=A0AAU9DKB8_9BACT|nr:hypothetical protein FUAX_54070 [Fulvitalea axinellae]